MVTKTRDRLIEVARQLFAHKGIDNTTMNDIAEASDKGRRTIYTYFKNKRDIYNAVVERESDRFLESLSSVVAAEAGAVDKLRSFLDVRFDLFNRSFSRRDSIRALFGRDFKRLQRIHKLLFNKERALLARILEQGLAEGVFVPARAAELPGLFVMLFQGVDFAQFRDNFEDTGLSESALKTAAIDYIMETITIKN